MNSASQPAVLNAIHKACHNNAITLLDQPFANLFLNATAGAGASSSTIELFYPLDRRGASFDDQGDPCNNLLGISVAQINLTTLINAVTRDDAGLGEKVIFNSMQDAGQQDAPGEAPFSQLGLGTFLNLDFGSSYKLDMLVKIGDSERNLYFCFPESPQLGLPAQARCPRFLRFPFGSSASGFELVEHRSRDESQRNCRDRFPGENRFSGQY